MRYTMTIEQDSRGYYTQLHNPMGELHYISRSFEDAESARQAAKDWAARYQVEIDPECLSREYLTNRDPGDETSP